MSDEKPDVAKSVPRMWHKYWWVPLSFVVPFVVIYFCMGPAAHLNIASCFRSGGIGFLSACGILALWALDQKIQGSKTSEPVGVMIGLLGIGLWLGWVVAAHVVVLANDEANYVADTERYSVDYASPSK